MAHRNAGHGKTLASHQKARRVLLCPVGSLVSLFGPAPQQAHTHMRICTHVHAHSHMRVSTRSLCSKKGGQQPRLHGERGFLVRIKSMKTQESLSLCRQLKWGCCTSASDRAVDVLPSPDLGSRKAFSWPSGGHHHCALPCFQSPWGAPDPLNGSQGPPAPRPLDQLPGSTALPLLDSSGNGTTGHVAFRPDFSHARRRF